MNLFRHRGTHLFTLNKILSKVTSLNFPQKKFPQNYTITELNDDFRMEAQQKLPHFVCAQYESLIQMHVYCFAMKIAKNYTHFDFFPFKEMNKKNMKKNARKKNDYWRTLRMDIARNVLYAIHPFNGIGMKCKWMEIGISENWNSFIDLWLITIECFVVTYFDFSEKFIWICHDDDKENYIVAWYNRFNSTQPRQTRFVYSAKGSKVLKSACCFDFIWLLCESEESQRTTLNSKMCCSV